MMNTHMEVGRGSTRGRRRGPARPAIHMVASAAGALPLTWDGSMGALVQPGIFTSEDGSANSSVENRRKAITWEGPRAADNMAGTPEPQVNTLKTK